MKFTIGGKWLLTLNNTIRPIANKYCEGKLKQNFEKRVKSQNVKLLCENRVRGAKRKRGKIIGEQPSFPLIKVDQHILISFEQDKGGKDVW